MATRESEIIADSVPGLRKFPQPFPIECKPRFQLSWLKSDRRHTHAQSEWATRIELCTGARFRTDSLFHYPHICIQHRNVMSGTSIA